MSIIFILFFSFLFVSFRFVSFLFFFVLSFFVLYLDGTTLYLSLAAVFCAQALAIPKSLGEQLVIVLSLMISSKGVAGVRSASIIVLIATLEQFGIPSTPIGLIIGVDWIMDMGRTFTNVLGNCVACVVLAKMEGEFRKENTPKDEELVVQKVEEGVSISTDEDHIENSVKN